MCANQHHLIVTALGSKQIGILEAFAKISKQCNCSIIESKFSLLGEGCGLYLYLQGNWNAIAKFETMLGSLATKLQLEIQQKRVLENQQATAILPYQVNVIAQDRVGILYDISRFFFKQQITISNCQADIFTPPKSTTKMVDLKLTVDVPSAYNMAKLRDNFNNYCDQCDLDAFLEVGRAN